MNINIHKNQYYSKIFQHKISTDAYNINKELEKFNIICIIVGGTIRNIINKQYENNGDIDIECYFSSISNIKNIIQNKFYAICVGMSFGVIKIPKSNIDLSVPRKDKCVGNKHTSFEIETPTYISYKIGAQRRDLTINSIGYIIKYNIIVDPYNGISDIKNKIIKPVDKETFIEDPLRILRAIYFQAKLEFKMSECTKKIIYKHSYKINNISQERIANEIVKIISYLGKNIDEVFKYLNLINHISAQFASKIYNQKNKIIIYKMILKTNDFYEKIIIISIFSNNVLKSIYSGHKITTSIINTCKIASSIITSLIKNNTYQIMKHIFTSNKMHCLKNVKKYCISIISKMQITQLQIIEKHYQVAETIIQKTKLDYLIDLDTKITPYMIPDIQKTLIENYSINKTQVNDCTIYKIIQSLKQKT